MSTAMNVNEALLPCPFCGGAPVHRETIEHYEDEDGPDSFSCRNAIQCDTCGIEISEEYHWEVVHVWNRRAATTGKATGEAGEALGVTFEKRVEWAEGFLQSYADGNREKLLGGFDFTAAVRRLAGAVQQMLATPQPAQDAEAVKVKALEWTPAALDGKFGWLVVRYAQTSFGRYYVEKFGEATYRVCFNDQVIPSILPTSIDEAIHGAQADFEARIAALDKPSTGMVEGDPS